MKCLPNPASQINKKIVTQTCPLYTKAELHVTRDMFHFHFTRHLKLLSKLIVHLLYCTKNVNLKKHDLLVAVMGGSQ